MSTLARLTGVARSLLIYRLRPARARRMRRFYRQFVEPGDLCVDVGAHVGDRVAAFRALGARVVAVEPQPHLYRLLRLLHGRDRGVALVSAALGAQTGQATLSINSRNPTLSTLSAAWAGTVAKSPRFPGERWDAAATVPVETLDRLIERHGRPAFVKIDVEGFEEEVLAGLSHAVPALSFEFLPETRDAALRCVWRAAALAPYRFNASPGERFRWLFREWLTAGEMARWLERRPPGEDGGDIYATLHIPPMD